MAKKDAAPPPPPEPVVDTPKLDGRMRLLLSMVIGAVVFFELILFVLFLPSPKSVAEAITSNIEERIKSPLEYELNSPVNEVNPVLPPNQVERTLGEEKYRTTSTNPNTPDRIETFEIKLFMRINRSDAAKWDALYIDNKETIRQEINLILRQAKPEYKIDPKLTVIRNSVRVKINEMFGYPYVQQVIFSDAAFNVM